MDILARQSGHADYQCISNGGAHGAALFHDRQDFERFLALLYIGNDPNGFTLRNLRSDAFAARRADPIVDIAAYCLMPDRYRVILRERSVGQARRFIHKVATAYVMYYNRKYAHVGTVFAGTCRSQKIAAGDSLRELIRQVHLGPASKEKGKAKAVDKASRWEYSSMRDYAGVNRPQRVILALADGGLSRP